MSETPASTLNTSNREHQGQFFLRAVQGMKRPTVVLFLVIVFWGLAFLNIMHTYFIESGGVSFLTPVFGWKPLAIALRILSVLGLIYVLISIARAFGAAETAQPFQRFARHLDRMGDGSRAHFHPRAGDIHIRILSDAFNDAIDKINGRADERQALADHMKAILNSNQSASQKLKKLNQVQQELNRLA